MFTRFDEATICPACVLAFINAYSVGNLGTELEDLFVNDVTAKRCNEHQDSDILVDMNTLRKIHNEK